MLLYLFMLIAHADDEPTVIYKKKTEIGIEIKSNKRNIIIKMFDSLDYNVIRLDLVFYGGLTKKDIPRKKYRFFIVNNIVKCVICFLSF